MGNRGYTQSPKTRPRISILCPMERISDYGSNVGTGHEFRKHCRRDASRLLTPTQPINEHNAMSQFEIPTITVTAPREEWDELAFVAKLKDAAKPTPDFPISPVTKLVRKASRKFKTTFTAPTLFTTPLSWSPPTQLPQLPFISTVKPPKTAIPSIEIEHLGQQLDCIAYFDELV